MQLTEENDIGYDARRIIEAGLSWWCSVSGGQNCSGNKCTCIWDNGRKAAVENDREGRGNGILLVKIGNAWKIRLTMQCCNAVSIPESIGEKIQKQRWLVSVIFLWGGISSLIWYSWKNILYDLKILTRAIENRKTETSAVTGKEGYSQKLDSYGFLRKNRVGCVRMVLTHERTSH